MIVRRKTAKRKIKECIGIVTSSPCIYMPIKEECKIVYDEITGRLKSAHRISDNAGTVIEGNKFQEKNTIWHKIEE